MLDDDTPPKSWSRIVDGLNLLYRYITDNCIKIRTQTTNIMGIVVVSFKRSFYSVPRKLN